MADRAADTLLATQGPFPLHLAANIGIQLATALASAHAEGALHRDITPANVLIDANWNATLTNSGAAQTSNPAYLTPETARGEDATQATDIYGLGATIWALVDGVPPFHQPGPTNPMQQMHRIATGQPSPPANAGPLTGALISMTAGDPAGRPNATQARDLFAAAAHAIATQPTAAGTGAFTQPGPINPAAPFGGGQPGVPPTWQASTLTAPGTTGKRRRSLTRPAVIISAIALLLIVAIVATVLVVHGMRHAEAAPDKYLPNPAAVDLCPLAKVPDYALFGTVTYTPGSWYGSCNVNINLTGGGTALVGFQMFSPQQLNGPVEQRGDLKIISPPSSDSTLCYRDVLLPDQNGLAVQTTITSSTTNPCVLSGVGVDAAVQHLHTVGAIPTDPNPSSPNSLRGQNTCQLLTAAEVGEVPGLDTSQVYPRYSNWDCDRGADLYNPTSVPWVEVYVARFNPLVAGTNGTPQTIDGRTVFVRAEAATGSVGDDCVAQVVNSRTTQLSAGDPREDVASVSVHANVPPDQECQLATKLAAKLIPRLPPYS